LPYMEQNNIWNQLGDPKIQLNTPKVNSISLAVTQKIFPVYLPFLRCPSDNFLSTYPYYSNYVASNGPQCGVGPPCGLDNPYQKYCNGGDGMGDSTPPPALPTPTYVGYQTSPNQGNTYNPTSGVDTGGAGAGARTYSLNYVRGMFTRLGPAVKISDVPDGLSNTLMIGEELVNQNSDIKGSPQNNSPPSGWYSFIGGNASGTTITPINYKSDFDDGNSCTTDPVNQLHK